MAHPELDQLLNSVLGFAREMLSKHGEFFPFGSSMDLAGKIAMDGAYQGAEHPPSQELIDLLTQAYTRRAEAGELRAAAICADVRIVPPGKSDKTDAISVGLEHQSGKRSPCSCRMRKAGYATASCLRQHGKCSSSRSLLEGPTGGLLVDLKRSDKRSAISAVFPHRAESASTVVVGHRVGSHGVFHRRQWLIPD